MATYQIQSRTAVTDDRDAAAWSSHVGDQNEFATEDEAEDGIDSLMALGGEWADAEYRVVPYRATAQDVLDLVTDLHDAGGNIRVTVEALLARHRDESAASLAAMVRESWAEATEEHAANVAAGR